MSKTQSLLCLVLLLAMAPASARCELTVTINCPQPCLIFLNGDYRGMAPQVLHAIPSGAHELVVENRNTGTFQVFVLDSPSNEVMDHSMYVNFYGNTRIVERVVRQREFEVQAYQTGQRQVMHPPHRGQAPQVYAYPVVVEPQRDHSPREHERIRGRNTILGVGVLNEVLGGGKSQKKVRKGVLGAGILNEILR